MTALRQVAAGYLAMRRSLGYRLQRTETTGESVRELAGAVGVGRATAYRYLNQQHHAPPT